MTNSAHQSSPAAELADEIKHDLLNFIETNTKHLVPADLDLFASGLISSLFAMELVVHLEEAFGIVIAGRDLRMENFRTVESMTALILRLRTAPGDGCDG